MSEIKKLQELEQKIADLNKAAALAQRQALACKQKLIELAKKELHVIVEGSMIHVDDLFETISEEQERFIVYYDEEEHSCSYIFVFENKEEQETFMEKVIKPYEMYIGISYN